VEPFYETRRMRLGVCRHKEAAGHTAAVVTGFVIKPYSTEPVLLTVDPGLTNHPRAATGAPRLDFPKIVIPHRTLYANTHTVASLC
jgi:hypothetical protein